MNKTIGQQIFEVSQIICDFLLLLSTILYSIVESIYKALVSQEPKPVHGEIVLITGTGHGIGKELAILYASEGAQVIGIDINEKNNKETMKEIIDRGYVKPHSYICDISIRENVVNLAKKVAEEIGDVSILINNAGIMPTHLICDTTEEEIQSIYKINVLAHLWTIQAFLPAMKKHNHGHIVGLSSCAGLFGLENLVAYCGSKFAVTGLMEALAEELRLGGYKIETTTIYPYMVNTGLCKKPKIKFEELMPLLEPKVVAKAIMQAQRLNERQVSVPKYLMCLNNYTRLLPLRAALSIKDFISSGVESD